MTNLEKKVTRVTSAVRHEKSKTRQLILSFEPPALVGVRLQGTRQTYRLPAEAIYELAVQAHERDVDREARRIAKTTRKSLRQARSAARQELKGRLR